MYCSTFCVLVRSAFVMRSWACRVGTGTKPASATPYSADESGKAFPAAKPVVSPAPFTETLRNTPRVRVRAGFSVTG
jgi:hypothetical protein